MILKQGEDTGNEFYYICQASKNQSCGRIDIFEKYQFEIFNAT